MPDIMHFPYFGPNRRSDKPVVEIRIDFDADDEHGFPQRLSDIRQLLVEGGILTAQERFPEQALPDDRLAWYTSLLAQTALLFQRKAGHRVDFFSVSCQSDQSRCTALVEHEHCDVGMTAVQLAVETLSGKRDVLTEPFRFFSEFARERILPLETGAIINAARRRDIPCFQLERQPLIDKLKKSSFRVRPNGLLLLGHGAHGHVLDGTFCPGKSGDYLKALLRNPGQRLALLKKLGMPVVQSDGKGLNDFAHFHLLAVNGQVTTVAERPDGRKNVVDDVHASFIKIALIINREVGLAPVVVTLLVRDILKPLAQSGGGVLGFELAPDLDRFLGQCRGRGPELMDAAAGALLDWLFPDPGSARMPVIAVTGTNGKTTTSRMISHILQTAGSKPGLVCTDGIFLNGKQVSKGDASTFVGHARALASKQVNVAVLETHHRGIAIRGFAFQWCDIVVCLNVTEDHLSEGEIETVEEMATVKRALVERARHAVVLNADDAHCMAMLDFVVAEKTCLVSLKSSVDELRALEFKGAGSFCVLELDQNMEWLVIHDSQRRMPVMPADQIPATFDGTARFNVSNAMHAVAASYLVGTGIEMIRAAMSCFSAGPEMTPGRMNVFDDLPFRVIVDFVHNPDGMKKVCEFVDRQNVTGRKLIAFAGTDRRSDEANRLLAQAVAGHFDFYFCKDYDVAGTPRRKFVGPCMQQVLIDEGVPEHQTMVLTFGRDVIFRILDACEPGDLLIIQVGHVEKQTVPGYIEEYTRR